ncbi:MAG: DNA primase [Chitinophagaceae bacterium]
MISQQSIQQILNRIDITEIIGGFVKLKKRGTNFLGLCPFHNEKTPSFTVSPAKEIYKCFGCGRSGNSISFLMEHEKFSYVESLRWLAAKYNITIEETELSPELKIQHQVADSLYIINSFAQKFFSQFLHENERGMAVGLSYLKERGFREEVIKKFELGFSPEDKNSFAQAATRNQFNQELLLKSGLVILRNDELFDNYRGRIIFPVHNNTGKIIGFGARIIRNNDKAPKYINTPENEVYSKSKILYGTYFARQAIDKNDECLLVEGYTDVIALHQAGIENVVASGGTSLTMEQLRLIRKYTNNLTIIYDGDPAGIKAALRGLDMALEEGLNVKLVLIPDKEDPDSYVNKLGATAFREFIASHKKDFILFQLEVSLKDAGDDSTKKAGVINQIASTIARISKMEDQSKKKDYIRQCADLMKIEETGFNDLVNKYIRERISGQKNTQALEEARTDEENVQAQNTQFDDATFDLLFQHQQQEKQVAKILLEYGEQQFDEQVKVADYIFNELIDEDLFDDNQILKLISLYKDWYSGGLAPNLKTFVYYNDLTVSALAVSLTNFPYEESKRMKEELLTNSSGYNDELFKKPYEEFMRITTRQKDDELPKFARVEEQNIQLQITSSLNYLKLKKIKRLMNQNQKDLQQPHTQDELMMLIQTHQHLKQIEADLQRKVGSVIVK